MQKNRKTILLAATSLVSVATFITQGAHAASWNQSVAATYQWNNNANWDAGVDPYPNGQGVVANVNNNIAGAVIINLPNSTVGLITVGELNIGDSDRTAAFTIGNNPLTFDNGVSQAILTKTGNGASSTARDTVSSAVVLNSDLAVTANAADNSVANSVLRFQGSISGTGGLIKDGNGAISLNAANSYTGLTVIKGGRIKLEGSSNTVAINGPVEIRNQLTLQGAANNQFGALSNIILPVDTSVPNNGANGGFFNPGFAGTDTTNDGSGLTGSPTQQTIGSLEGTAYGSQVGGGGRGTLTFGNDQDKTFEGRLGGRTNFVKIGTGVQTLGGTQNDWQQATTFNGLPVQRQFIVLAGRVELNKTETVASIAQGILKIGDGSKSGIDRPEVRLLKSNQIEIQTFDDGVNPITRSETTVMTLNGGIFNANGNSETIGSAVVTGNSISTIAVGAAGSIAFAGGMTVNDGATAEIKIGTGGAINTTALTINGSGKIDLTDSRGLQVSGGDANAIRAAIIAGRAVDGSWTGTGITSSSAALDPMNRAIGYTSASGVVSVGFTATGDANLDGIVNSSDFSALADAYNSTSGGWGGGDFNYDGVVNALDFNAMASNFGTDLNPQPLGSLVPEPMSMSLIGIGALSLMRRRKQSIV
jgi:autotransporter-associated beta strand protein